MTIRLAVRPVSRLDTKLERSVGELGDGQEQAPYRGAAVDRVSPERKQRRVLRAEQPESGGDQHRETQAESDAEEDDARDADQRERERAAIGRGRCVRSQARRAGHRADAEDQACAIRADCRSLVTSSSGAASGWPSCHGTTMIPAAMNCARSASRFMCQSR